MKITDAQRESAASQISEQRVLVDFDVGEYSVELIALKFKKKEIFVPDYQREFVWEPRRKSGLIESLVLGLPIPFVFVADVEGDLEIVDGTQRIRTIVSYLDNEFKLTELKILNDLNGFKYSDLPMAEQKRIKNRTIRMIMLSAKADLAVRFEVFQRINLSPRELTDAEFRKGAFQGPFYNMVLELAQDPGFRKLCPISENKAKRGEAEELVLRFFVYSDKYESFTHDVGRFLNRHLDEHKNAGEPEIEHHRKRFRAMVEFAQKYMPDGFVRNNMRQTPRVRFEALACGMDLALRTEPELVPGDLDWLSGEEFAALTRSDGSNSGPRLRARVEFVRDRLLGPKDN